MPIQRRPFPYLQGILLTLSLLLPLLLYACALEPKVPGEFGAGEGAGDAEPVSDPPQSDSVERAEALPESELRVPAGGGPPGAGGGSPGAGPPDGPPSCLANATRSDFASACGCHDDCFTGYCLPGNDNGASVCSYEGCEDAPGLCPTDWTCREGARAIGGQCVPVRLDAPGEGRGNPQGARPSGAGGPREPAVLECTGQLAEVGEACGCHEDCETDHCMAMPGADAPAPFCTISDCRPEGQDCPEDWTCFMPPPELADRPSICLPPGVPAPGEGGRGGGGRGGGGGGGGGGGPSR